MAAHDARRAIGALKHRLAKERRLEREFCIMLNVKGSCSPPSTCAVLSSRLHDGHRRAHWRRAPASIRPVALCPRYRRREILSAATRLL